MSARSGGDRGTTSLGGLVRNLLPKAHLRTIALNAIHVKSIALAAPQYDPPHSHFLVGYFGVRLDPLDIAATGGGTDARQEQQARSSRHLAHSDVRRNPMWRRRK